MNNFFLLIHNAQRVNKIDSDIKPGLIQLTILNSLISFLKSSFINNSSIKVIVQAFKLLIGNALQGT